MSLPWRLILIGLYAAAIGCPQVGTAEVQANIEYGRAGKDRLLLDAGVPDGPGPFPVVVVVHGGGWMSGDKRDGMSPILQPLTDANLVWFSVNYRMAPASRWPACLDDVNAAIAWVKAHAADFKGDSHHIALLGYSAGGQIACMAATTAHPQTAVQAVVGLAPPTDLELDLPQRGGLSVPLQNLLDRPHELSDNARVALQQISAVHFIHPGLPPFLIMHGTADKSVPYPGSVAFADQLRKAHVPCDLLSLPNAPHRIADWSNYDPAYGSKMTNWLNATLRGLSPATRPTGQK